MYFCRALDFTKSWAKGRNTALIGRIVSRGIRLVIGRRGSDGVVSIRFFRRPDLNVIGARCAPDLHLENQLLKRFADARRERDELRDIREPKRFSATVAVDHQHDAIPNSQGQERRRHGVISAQLVANVSVRIRIIELRDHRYAAFRDEGERGTHQEGYRDALNMIGVQRTAHHIHAFDRLLVDDKECRAIEELPRECEHDFEDLITGSRRGEKIDSSFCRQRAAQLQERLTLRLRNPDLGTALRVLLRGLADNLRAPYTNARRVHGGSRACGSGRQVDLRKRGSRACGFGRGQDRRGRRFGLALRLLKRRDIRNIARILSTKFFGETEHPRRHIDAEVMPKGRGHSDFTNHTLRNRHPEQKTELRFNPCFKWLGDRHHETALGRGEGHQAMTFCDLSRNQTDKVPRDLHHLIACRGEKSMHRGAVGRHDVLRKNTELEEHRIHLAARQNLTLNRLFHPADGESLIANQ